MFSPVSSLLMSASLAWTMVVVAALARSRAISIAGLRAAMGNRDDLPEPSGFASRADRAARNMLENLVLFGTVLLAASMARVPAGDLAIPCAIFVGGRVVHALLYWGGVRYVRTVAWAVSLLGMAWIGALAA
jgi:uncharacterized MAPEG superfamily protein